MTDRIYKLIELAAIRMMPGFYPSMESFMYKTEYFDGKQCNVLDLELTECMMWNSWSGDDPYTPDNLEAMLRLKDLRDGKIRRDVPERCFLLYRYPECCPVWVMAQPKPKQKYTDFGPDVDLPF